jgi:predicted O-methyltransferase YrrM
MLKSIVKKLLQRRGYELCQLYDSEKEDVPDHANFTFRESQCFRAIGNLGQISIVEGRLLSEIVRNSDVARPIIEIGTLFGFSTTVMTLAKSPEQQLITVDNYSWNPLGLSPHAHFSTTRNRLSEAVARHSVKIVNMDKDEFYRTYSGPPPAVFFCDADHSYEATKADILWARSIGASIICGDDYDHPYQRGTAQAVDELGGPARLAGGLFVM